MERGSDKHGPRIDEALRHDVGSLLGASPTELHTDEWGDQDSPAEGEAVARSVTGGRGLTGPAALGPDEVPAVLEPAEIEGRAELARHLPPSIFPARREDLLASAASIRAPDAVLVQLGSLPDGTFENVARVWEALGGRTEHRKGAIRHPDSAQDEIGGATGADSWRRSPELRFPFRFTSLYRLAGAPLGITPSRAVVSLADGRFEARFGPWSLSTPLENVAGTTVTGPYRLWRTAGPPHLSLADGGLTFATNHQRGLCIRFVDPVPGVEPWGRIRHRALTVTVEDVEGLARGIEQARAIELQASGSEGPVDRGSP